MRWGIVQDGVVVQVIAWDGVSDYATPDGSVLVQHDGVNVGWTFVDGVLVEPEYEVVDGSAVVPLPDVEDVESAVAPEPESV